MVLIDLKAIYGELAKLDLLPSYIEQALTAAGEGQEVVLTGAAPVWLYLTIAGSLIAYTAYVWLLHVSTPARVATYAYVNPLIAVVLGCTLGREVFSHELLLAGSLIIVAVILIVRGGAQPAPKTISQSDNESRTMVIRE